MRSHTHTTNTYTTTHTHTNPHHTHTTPTPHTQVVFNCIDYGEYFDCAVSSLCVALGLSYVTASSYGHMAIAECYPLVENPQRGPCWVCNNTPARGDLVDKITPDKITQLSDLLFLPKVGLL